jgi:hypothetical protein
LAFWRKVHLRVAEAAVEERLVALEPPEPALRRPVAIVAAAQAALREEPLASVELAAAGRRQQRLLR